MASPPLLPAPVAARSSACSTDSTVSTPNATGTPLSSARALQAAGTFAGDVLEMRRVAADHAAERHQRVEAAAAGEATHGHRQLEGPGHAHHRQLARLTAALEPGGLRSLEKACDDEIVEARCHDRHLASVRVRLAFDDAWRAHPSSPT